MSSVLAGVSGRDQDRWDRVALEWPAGPPPLWRRQSDLVNAMLVDRWVPERLGRVLKTDLFDELSAEGVYPLLRPRANQVVAVDVSTRAVAAACERYPQLEAVVADVTELPFGDAHFDAAFSNSTLDHLRSRVEVATALGELARVLRPGGLLVITLDNPLNPLVALRNLLPPSVARSLRQVPYDAGWTCGPRSLHRLLRESEFEVLELTAVLHFPRVVVARLGDSSRRAAEDRRWLRALRTSERLERWPTRFVTGHFVAALARRDPRPRPAHRPRHAPAFRSGADLAGPGSDRRWTVRSALARSIELAREQGPRSLWFGALGELAYRRLAVFELPLGSPPPQPGATTPIAVEPLGDDDFAEYSALHPEVTADEISRRLATGHRCWLARSAGELIASCWVAHGRLWSAYLEREIPLAPDEACTYETFTGPSARGMGIGSALRGSVARDLHEHGYRRLLATVLSENRPAIRLVEKLGYVRIGTIGYVRIGSRRRDFCSVRRGAASPGQSPVEGST